MQACGVLMMFYRNFLVLYSDCKNKQIHPHCDDVGAKKSKLL